MNEIETRTADIFDSTEGAPGAREGAPDLPGLAMLEERIAQAARLIQTLKDENRRLLGEHMELEEQIRVLDSAERRDRVRQLESRIGALEREKGDLLQEKRAVSARIEEILEKLRFLEA